MANPLPENIQKVLNKTLGLRNRYKDVQATSISIAHYYDTTGFIQRCEDISKKRLIGYCSEEPQKVLDNLIQEFNITQYKGLDFYSSEDMQKAPKIGISIGVKKFNGIYGVKYDLDGKLGEMFELFDEEFKPTKRKNSFSDRDRLEIIKNLNHVMYSSAAVESPNQECLQSTWEAIEVLTRVKEE